MLLSSHDLIVFHTKESDGGDICIMDSLRRFTLVNEDEIDDLCEMLQQMKNKDTYSIFTIDPQDYVEPDDYYL